MCAHFVVYICFLIFLGYNLEMLGQVVTLCLTSEELPDCFPKEMHYFTVSSTPYKCSNFSTFSPTFVTICLFDYSHPSECEVVSQCGFVCISLMASDAENVFMSLLSICISALENYSDLLSIFNCVIFLLLLSLKVLCIFQIQLLFANIFSLLWVVFSLF